MCKAELSSQSMLATLFTFLTAVSTIAGGMFAVRHRHHVHLLLGFGSGVLLGAVFFNLLPEALEAGAQQSWTSRTVLVTAVE
jgi:ZIP family zinc transporter